MHISKFIFLKILKTKAGNLRHHVLQKDIKPNFGIIVTQVTQVIKVTPDQRHDEH